MKRTVFSSYLFLFLILQGVKHNDIRHTMISSIAMGVSLCHHSHVGTNNKLDKKIFKLMDISFMQGIVSPYACYLAKQNEKNKELLFLAVIDYILYIKVLCKARNMEDYSEFQKNIHMLFHIINLPSIHYLYKNSQNSFSNS